MRSRDALDAPEALVLTMVLVAAADGGRSDREIGVMAGQVQTLPAFHDFSTEQLRTATEAAVNLLNEVDGLQHAARLMLSFVRDELHLDPLVASAIERGVRARHQRVEPDR